MNLDTSIGGEYRAVSIRGQQNPVMNLYVRNNIQSIDLIVAYVSGYSGTNFAEGYRVQELPIGDHQPYKIPPPIPPGSKIWPPAIKKRKPKRERIPELDLPEEPEDKEPTIH